MDTYMAPKPTKTWTGSTKTPTRVTEDTRVDTYAATYVAPKPTKTWTRRTKTPTRFTEDTRVDTHLCGPEAYKNVDGTHIQHLRRRT